MPHRISIIIITYNRAADTLELLQSLSTQEYKEEFLEETLVLNNASAENYDAVRAYIRDTPSIKARFIDAEANLGVAKGRNRLLEQVKGDVILCLDDDMIFTKPGDIGVLAGLFDEPFFKEANTGVITFSVIYYSNRQVQVNAFPHKNYEKWANVPRFLTSYFAGGAHIMKTEVLNKTGLYPTDFHYGMEEYDLGYRVVDAGYTIGFDNSVAVAHKESPFGRTPNYRTFQWNWINKSKVAWRHLPMKYFVTTALSWGYQYLKISKWHLGIFFATFVPLLKIPFTEKRKVINKKALEYLRSVEARLKY
jgi:GT2 family glycosyltransferase